MSWGLLPLAGDRDGSESSRSIWAARRPTSAGLTANSNCEAKLRWATRGCFLPPLAVETVAAGGGSICRRRDGRIQVGPESAGARPGPACYGAGGPLTVTDVNLLLGRLVPSRFPFRVDVEAASRRADEVEAAEALQSREALLAGILAIANERMAGAIRTISTRRGYDPSEYTLVAFGGAGAQHAARIAELLGMRRVLVPEDGALLSAAGLLAGSFERWAERQVLEPLASAGKRLNRWFEDLSREAREALEAEGVVAEEIETGTRTAFLRYQGQESTLAVSSLDGRSPEALEEEFERHYRARYGYLPEQRTLEVESPAGLDAIDHRGGGTFAKQKVCWRRRPGADPYPALLGRDGLGRGSGFRTGAPRGRTSRGRALSGRRDPYGDRRRVGLAGYRGSYGRPGSGARPVMPDFARSPAEAHRAIRLELFTHRFAQIVGEMGELLQRTAVSVNVKERLDFSCALLDPAGRLVVNAPHIPVHLGALGLCVRRVSETVDWNAGDVVVTNHPGFGGSHLPDVTVVTPVFEADPEDGTGLLGFVANRAHHAEIGGSRPGSMPPDATCLAEEGVVLPPTLLARGGVFDWPKIRSAFSGRPLSEPRD